MIIITRDFAVSLTATFTRDAEVCVYVVIVLLTCSLRGDSVSSISDAGKELLK